MWRHDICIIQISTHDLGGAKVVIPETYLEKYSTKQLWCEIKKNLKKSISIIKMGKKIDISNYIQHTRLGIKRGGKESTGFQQVTI